MLTSRRRARIAGGLLVASISLASLASRASEPASLSSEPAAGVSSEAPGTSPFSIGLALGMGIAQNVLGIGLEVRHSHFGAGIAAGPLLIEGPAASAALRYFTQEGRVNTWIFSLQGGFEVLKPLTQEYDVSHRYAVTAMVTRRSQSGSEHFFWDVGVGGGVGFSVINHEVKPFPVPDLRLALGYEF